MCDNTGELLAVRLRPGTSNANHTGDHTGGDHTAVPTEAIAHIPADRRSSMVIRRRHRPGSSDGRAGAKRRP